jgi:hypothetical protein
MTSRMSCIWLRILLKLAKVVFVIQYKLPKRFSRAISLINDSLLSIKRYCLNFSKNLKPLPLSTQNQKLEVHTILCKRDIAMYLWAIRSLIFYMKLNCPIVVHDDGSLDEADVQLLSESLPGITIITRADSDSKASELLNEHPACQKYRKESFLGVKLFDYNLFSNADWILSFDSDILFFDKGQELMKGIEERNTILYNKEYGNNAYRSDALLIEQYPYIVDGFNSGLFLYPKSMFQLSTVEEITFWLQKNVSKISFPHFRIDDQIIYSILTGLQSSLPLSSKYSTNASSKILQQQLICKHFHSAWKDGFWLEGIDALLEKKPGFLNF